MKNLLLATILLFGPIITKMNASESLSAPKQQQGSFQMLMATGRAAVLASCGALLLPISFRST